MRHPEARDGEGVLAFACFGFLMWNVAALGTRDRSDDSNRRERDTTLEQMLDKLTAALTQSERGATICVHKTADVWSSLPSREFRQRAV